MSTALELVGPRSGSAPYVYTVAETGTFDPMTVHALFNGAGAAATFMPCLTIKAQDGTIIARVFPASNVTAGNATRVTFAPFLRGAQSSGSGVTAVDSPNGSITVTNPGGPTVSVDTAFQMVTVTKSTTQLNPIPGVNITWDSIIIDTSGGTMWSAGAPTKITIPITGTYAFWTNVCFKLSAAGIGITGIQSTSVGPQEWRYVAAAGDFQSVVIGCIDRLSAGAFVTVNAQPLIAANLTVNSGGGTSFFGCARIG